MEDVVSTAIDGLNSAQRGALSILWLRLSLTGLNGPRLPCAYSRDSTRSTSIQHPPRDKHTIILLLPPRRSYQRYLDRSFILWANDGSFSTTVCQLRLLLPARVA